ncbi:uncharacterized protein LOC123305324 [Chrysoperla carnea]|uniref:uncharacterized protein LOC123305324 n=1 Tax=Chrysoperla carnea TaxID=189513 RepID=UPI001D080572|nr:uncharacterized protein LOC123305324 [Chrysoperla carnea]
MIKQEDLNIDKSSDEEDKNDNGEVELNTDKCIKMENTEDTLGTRFPPKQNKSKAFCCVYGCGSRAWRNPDVRFHKFPKENVCFVKVTNSLGVEEKIDCRHMWQRVLKIEKNITEHMLVCSLHFRKSDYFLPDLDSKNKRCLKKNSVPSSNLPGDDYKTGYDVKTIEGGYFRTKEVMIKQENCNIDKTNEEDNENENGEVELNTHKRASTSSTIKFDKCITIENTEDTFGTRFPSKQNKSKAFCCVPGCRSKACRNPDVRFHRFPKENVCFVKVRNCFGVEEKIDCRKMWQRVLKIEKNITEYMLVCSLHFSKADYFLPDLNSKRLRRLKKNAVPSCNLPG